MSAFFRADDLYLFNEGRNYRAYNQLGAHLASFNGERGTSFSVWAPNARKVSVIGNFNDWNSNSHPLESRGTSGIWEGLHSRRRQGTLYTSFTSSLTITIFVTDKADPFGIYHEEPPRTASVVWDLDYQWADREWMRSRAGRQTLQSPISIYEVHWVHGCGCPRNATAR